jgi:hypothetical protein
MNNSLKAKIKILPETVVHGFKCGKQIAYCNSIYRNHFGRRIIIWAILGYRVPWVELVEVIIFRWALRPLWRSLTFRKLWLQICKAINFHQPSGKPLANISNHGYIWLYQSRTQDLKLKERSIHRCSLFFLRWLQQSGQRLDCLSFVSC